MGILLRPLYAKVAFMRPDLEETAKIGFAVQEAMREVCRRTFLARTGILLDLTDTSVSYVSIPLDSNQNLLKIHKVDYLSQGAITPMSPATVAFMENRLWGPGTPRWYAQQGQTIQFWPPTADATSQLRLNVSYVPGVEVDEAPLPELAVTAIEARAEAMLLRLPSAPGGPNYQNLQLAEQRDQDFHRAIGNLKAISFYGEVGDLIASPEPFPGAP